MKNGISKSHFQEISYIVYEPKKLWGGFCSWGGGLFNYTSPEFALSKKFFHPMGDKKEMALEGVQETSVKFRGGD